MNKKDVKNASALSNVFQVLYKASEVTAYIDPEILSLGKEKVMAIIDKHPEVEEHRFLLTKLFDKNEHILSPKEEQLLALFNPLKESGSELYDQLSTADGKPREAILENGDKVMVTKGNWTALVDQAKSPIDRERIFKAHFSVYEEDKNTYAKIYKTVLDSDKATSKARNYSSSLEMQ